MGFITTKRKLIGPVLTGCAFFASAFSVFVPAVNGAVTVVSPGIIRGFVRDQGGNPIADASVAIFKAGTAVLLKQVNSGSDGSFLAKIVPGTYTVLAVAQGFNPVTLFGVEVSRSADLTYGFKLEKAGAGNTLPEKRADRNSSKWRIRAAQMQRSIYQNTEGNSPVTDDEVADETGPTRKGQTVAETYFAGTSRGNFAGINAATLIPLSDDAEIVIAGQTGVGRNAPLRLETALTYRPNANHQLRLNSSAGKLGIVQNAVAEKSLGQVSFRATDEWKVREGVVFVFGLDYSKFVGAGGDSSLSPRLGVQFDPNSKTRLRSSFTTQTADRSWATALDLEGTSVAFAEPVAIEDLKMAGGKPLMNKSRRLEFGVERVLDSRSSVEANVFFDTTPSRGVGINNIAFDTLGGDGFDHFVANQQGRARGVRVVYSRRLRGPLSAAAGYSFGNGQKLSRSGITDPAHIFESEIFQTFFAQLAADLKTGTSVKAIYRLSPDATVFAIDPFKGRLAIYDPGLSILVTQSLPTLGLPFRAQAVVDARNLLDFQTGVSGEDGGLRLGNQGRMVRGGIQVRF